MGKLDRRVVLVTDTGDSLGQAAAYAVNAEGALVVANDAVGAGTRRAAADEMVRTLKRRGCPAIASYSKVSSFRDAVTMMRVGFDKWDWVSGIVHIDRDGGQSLQNVLRAAAHPMKEWGGALVVINASDAACAIIQEQADSMAAGRLLINAVRPTTDDSLPAERIIYLMSPDAIRDRVCGQVFTEAPEPAPQPEPPAEVKVNTKETGSSLKAASTAPTEPPPEITHPAPTPRTNPPAPTIPEVPPKPDDA